MIALFATLGLFTGCKAPPDAPKTLDELASFLFVHADDEDTEVIRVALENLDNWLEENEATEIDGYRVDNLDEEAVASVDLEYNEDGLVGASVAFDIDHPVEDVIAVFMLAKSDPDAEPSGLLYEREYLAGDRTCLATADCDRLDYTSHAVDYLPLGLNVESWTRTQHRRIPLPDGGDALIQRSWMTQPAESNFDWLNIEQQFWIATLTPWEGNSRRMEAGWVLLKLGDVPIPESLALKIALDEMRGTKDWVEGYIEDKGVPEPEEE